MRLRRKQSYDEFMAEQRVERGWTSIADSPDPLTPGYGVKYGPTLWALAVFGRVYWGESA